jgi:hypothetical protein
MAYLTLTKVAKFLKKAGVPFAKREIGVTEYDGSQVILSGAGKGWEAEFPLGSQMYNDFIEALSDAYGDLNMPELYGFATGYNSWIVRNTSYADRLKMQMAGTGFSDTMHY